jgi:hypothetical protein
MLAAETPKFAMKTIDVDPIADPDERRYTAHVFDSEHDAFVSIRDRNGIFRMVTRGSTATVAFSCEFPPDILFDDVYGTAVALQFSKMSGSADSPWLKHYYPGGVKNAQEETDSHQERAKARNNARSPAQDEGLDVWDMLLHIPYVLIPLERVRRAIQKRAVKEHNELDDKVGSWLQDFDDNVIKGEGSSGGNATANSVKPE